MNKIIIFILISFLFSQSEYQILTAPKTIFQLSSNNGLSSKIALNNYSNPLYLRLEVKDKPGVLSSITKQLAKYNISVKRLIQIPDHKRKTASIAIITHQANELNSKKCIKSFNANKNIIKSPVLIRLF